MGRPSAFTPELGDAICDRVAGRPLAAVCRDEDMPSRETVYSWLRKHKEFLDNYTRARATRAFARADQIDDVIEGVRSGDIKPDAARVEIDALKWQAGKENAPLFGDRLALAGDKDAPIAVEATVTLEPGDAYLRMLNGG